MRKRVKSFWGSSLVYCVALFVFLLSACAGQPPAPTGMAQPTTTTKPSATASVTASPVPPKPTQSPTPPPTLTPGPVVCSLLEGIAIPDLSEVIVNPYAPPRLGSDDPHQGIDFAEIDPAYQIALEGQSVLTVMDGAVAGVIEDRFPYGNAILVESPLAQLPVDWVTALQIPTPAPTREGHPSLTCPEGTPPDWSESERSLYLIYAHLQEPPAFQVSDTVTCGQRLNAIGNSGNSLNPHVHLELRVGPAGASFESMAHYTGSASPQEMYNYCLWRVSETFQLLDPMRLFEPGSK